MTGKKRSIRRKMLMIVLMISLVALLLAAMIGIVSMLSIQREVLLGSETLGDHAAQKSEHSLTEQMEKSLLDIASGKAELADAKLGMYLSYVDMFARYSEALYDHPDQFVLTNVAPPMKENKGTLSLQRYLLDQSISLQTVLPQVGLLGNLVNVFDPIIKENSEIITTIYIGTEEGFLLSYDDRADLGDTDSEEEYYNFSESDWYLLAKQVGQPVFTDTYLDSYGRGLTISCAAPFYQDDTFLGVVCMDILVTDLNNSIIDVNIGDNSYAFLVNANGDVIASPEQDPNSDQYVSIVNDTSASAYSVSEEIMSGNVGVTPNDDGNYYAYTPISSASWTLAIYVPAEDIIGPALEIRDVIRTDTQKTSESMRSAIMISIIIFCAAFIVIMITVMILSDRFSRRLTEPLLSLRKDVGIISSGNLSHRAAVVSEDEIGDLAAAFNDMSFSLQTYITNLTAITAEKERIGAELNVATQIQASMLPCIFPAFPDRPEFDIYASMLPAKEVGGDFYDFFLIDNEKLAVVMADVSGKGVPAALFMVIAKTLIKNNAQYGKTPKEVFEIVNDMLCENNEAGMFVTAFMGFLEIPTGTFTYVNAGHNPPLIKRSGNHFEWLPTKPCFVLAGMEEMSYRQDEITLHPGDTLYMYTDGVTEAVNRSEELFT
ncbi:MAG: SpoIIE family protein phosphatase, partial [Lachnospiraceae bacterium]|nr:SpoIIE family protein phosphatase [Lachnospiraceae bacterium]